MEMKKNTAMSAMTDTYSTAVNTTPVRITHTAPYAASSFAGAIFGHDARTTKRPINRQSMAMDRKNAPWLSRKAAGPAFDVQVDEERPDADLRRHIEELRRHPGDEFLMGQQGSFIMAASSASLAARKSAVRPWRTK